MRGNYYSKEFKEQAVLKLLNRGSKSISEICNELNTSSKNIYRWKLEFNKVTEMGNLKNKIKTAEEKFKVLIETSQLSENELGEYLRTNGLYSTDLKEWKKSLLGALSGAGRPKSDPKIKNLTKTNQALSKDLQRKDKALAEMSARVILLKKSHLLFGETEGD